MKSYQHKFGWLVAVIAAAATLTACAPEFTDDVCITSDDCFANELCLASACVAATQNNDVGNDTTEDTETPTLNACGGISELVHELGAPCGPCNLDKYICDGNDNTVCDGSTACPEISLVTTIPTEITATGATFHGQIQILSENLPTDHGFCWATDISPTATNGKCHSLGPLTADKVGTNFSHTVDQLNPGTAYHVRVFHTDTTGTIYANSIEFTTLAPFPTNLTATKGTETAHVKLEWDDMLGAKKYHIYRNDVLLGEVDSDTTIYNDINAEAGQLTASQNPTASEGTLSSVVELSANPAAVAQGASQPYAVRATYANAQSAHSPEVNGFRGVGPVTYQWERSLADVSQNFSPLTGANTLSAQDTTAPANGDKRFYRVIASAEGAAPKTSSAVAGYRQVGTSPAVFTPVFSDITTTGAKATATIDNVGTPPATVYGFCIGNLPNPDTSCVTLGAPPASGTIDYNATGLIPGTTYHVRAFLTVGAIRHFSADASFMTLPVAPSGVTATSDNTALVKISWSAVTGAATYEVLRDGISIIANLAQTTHDDTGADAPAAAAAPTLSTVDAAKHVTLNWTVPTTAPGTEHTYTVFAVNANGGKSAVSTGSKGRRAARTITGYEISRDSNAWINVGLVTTYNDTTAPPASIITAEIDIRVNQPAAGRNSFVILQEQHANGADVSYQVRAVTGSVDGTSSNSSDGHRTLMDATFTYQWQSSTAGDPFTPIAGQTIDPYIDTNPSGQKVRLVISAEGAQDKISNELTSNLVP